jgi:hypothetical protein
MEQGMKNPEFEFCFDGREAEADAQAWADWLAREFPDWRVRPAANPPPPTPGTRDLALTVAIIALIVSLPGGIKDSLDLAEQLQLKAKFERLIARARERRAQRRRNPFIALPPQGKPVPLDQVKPEQLLEALAARTPKPPPKP